MRFLCLMKANELRIGNLVFHPIVDTVFEISREDFAYHRGLSNVEHYRPIPLTEEWLLKFGFDTKKLNPHIYDIEARGEFFSINKRINKDSFEVSFYTYYEDVNFENFKYVHQLQNLYFALTNTELEVK